MARESGAEVLVNCLLAEGVSTCFGIPGVTNLELYDALLDHPELRHVGVRHEQAAVYMADGYARATGEVGVAFTSGGPGALNTLTAMGTAFNDSVPVLHVVSANARALKEPRGYFHDISDQFGVFRPVTGFGIQVERPEEIPGAVAQAMNALRNRRPRPAVIEISEDAFKGRAAVTYEAPVSRRRVEPKPADVEHAAALLAESERVVLWVGGGVIAAGGGPAVVALAERLSAPILTSQAGKGAVPADHPLHVGNWASELPVKRMLAEADALVAVGTRLSYFPTRAWTVQLPPRVVHIDVDAAVIGRNYPVEIGMVADARLAVEAILERLPESAGRDGEAIVERVRSQMHAKLGERLEIQILDAIRGVLPASGMVFNDPTTLAFWARLWWPAYEPRTWFIPSGFGTLGYALPAAIGARIAKPETPVVALMGDAGSMFTIQELMTAVQERAGVVLVVFNDRGYGVERKHQDDIYGRRSAVDVLPPDFVALAQAFGADGVLVEDPADIGAALAGALERGRPAILEVPLAVAHPGYTGFADWSDLEEPHVTDFRR
jgi:thiamine pyrophosphate-dependent acetolactate synthase large subunit-like protein